MFVDVRPLFYYRGNEIMAVRHGAYKAHLWTWAHSVSHVQLSLKNFGAFGCRSFLENSASLNFYWTVKNISAVFSLFL